MNNFQVYVTCADIVEATEFARFRNGGWLGKEGQSAHVVADGARVYQLAEVSASELPSATEALKCWLVDFRAKAVR